MTSCKLNSSLNVRTFHAISKLEPTSFKNCKGRSFSLINAVIYSFRVFVDPICSVCLVVTHLFKTLYHILSTPDVKGLNKAKIEILKVADYILYGVCAPVFNCILAGKCTAGSIQPKICYRQATPEELAIIDQFHKYKKQSFELGCLAVKDIKAFNLKTNVQKKIERLKRISEKTRIAFFKMKLYTV